MDKEFVAINNEFEQIKCQILATFYMNNKNYLFYKDNENKVYAGFIDKGDVKQILRKEEFEQVSQVFKLLKGEGKKPNFIELATQVYKGIPYKTIYDNIEEKCYTYKFLDNKFNAITGEEEEYFDKLYNTNIDILCNADDFLESANEAMKKVIKVGGVFVIVLLLADFSIPAFKTLDLDKGFVHNVTQIAEVYKVDAQDANNVLSYINNNSNISKEDKQFILSKEHFFFENEKYFDMASIKMNLMNLEIKYENGNHAKYEMSDKVKGFYRKSSDMVVVLCSDGINDGNPLTEKILFHELMHAISNNGYLANGSLGLTITEGVNELMAEEYLNSSSDIYNKAQTYARILCELVGPDVVKESFFTGNMDLLVEELAKIGGNEKHAIKFISLIDTEGKADSDIIINESSEKVKDAEATLKIVQPEIDKYLQFYYESKFKSSFNDDRLMLAYYDSLRVTNTLNYSGYEEGNIDRINVVKNYFNSELPSDNVTVEYYYKDDSRVEYNYYKIVKSNDDLFKRSLSENNTNGLDNTTLTLEEEKGNARI